MNPFKKHSPSQTTIELAVVAVLVLVAMTAMTPYVIRSINGYMRSWERRADQGQIDVNIVSLPGIPPDQEPDCDTPGFSDCDGTTHTACTSEANDPLGCCIWVKKFTGINENCDPTGAGECQDRIKARSTGAGQNLGDACHGNFTPCCGGDQWFWDNEPPEEGDDWCDNKWACLYCENYPCFIDDYCDADCGEEFNGIAPDCEDCNPCHGATCGDGTCDYDCGEGEPGTQSAFCEQDCACENVNGFSGGLCAARAGGGNPGTAYNCNNAPDGPWAVAQGGPGGPYAEDGSPCCVRVKKYRCRGNVVNPPGGPTNCCLDLPKNESCKTREQAEINCKFDYMILWPSLPGGGRNYGVCCDKRSCEGEWGGYVQCKEACDSGDCRGCIGN